MFERGDIVEVYFDLPYSKETKLHPAIIISNEYVYNKDEVYVCVMMTSSTITDLFSFEIEPIMLDLPVKKEYSQARCHLISYVKEKHFEKHKLNHMKKAYVDNLVARINTVALII